MTMLEMAAAGFRCLHATEPSYAGDIDQLGFSGGAHGCTPGRHVLTPQATPPDDTTGRHSRPPNISISAIASRSSFDRRLGRVCGAKTPLISEDFLKSLRSPPYPPSGPRRNRAAARHFRPQ